MKWQPQDIVALMLASLFIILVVKGFILDFLQIKDNVNDDLWRDPINMIIGGLISYIMLKKVSDKKDL